MMTHLINQILVLLFFITIISFSSKNNHSVNGQIPSMIDNPRYFDSVNGDDKNDGLTPETPWKSLILLNQITCLPGTSIYLKAGSQWHASIALHGSGSGEYPIVMNCYGKGKAPIISGDHTRYTLKLENQQYWEIKNVEISNYHASEETLSMTDWELHNINYWAEGNELPQDTVSRINKVAILVLAKDTGELKHLHFSNLEIHGVNGNIFDKDNGGLFIQITGDKKRTWFSDLLVEKCYIHDVDRTGISNRSSWNKRTSDTNTNWVPSENIIIRNNTFERTGANALIIREAQSPLVEYNLFDHCAIKHTGNTSFPFNCNDALWQHNEARFTKYNAGDVDAGGFDSDYRCKNTIIRYNFSHDNEYGGVLVCCQGGDESRFNLGTQICYNIFANNLNHVFRISGVPSNTHIYNNVVYHADDTKPAELIWHKKWGGYPSRTTYSNNIFYSNKQNLSIDLSKSKYNQFLNNIFYGKFSGDTPHNQINANPLFHLTNYNGTPTPEAFMILADSPAIHSGTQINNCPVFDLFGNTIQIPPNIGVHEF